MSPSPENTVHLVPHEEWLRFIQEVECPETMRDLELVRRRHPRYSLKDLYAKIVFTLQVHLSKVGRAWTVSVLDLSAEGVMLKTQDEIPAGTPLALQIGVGEQVLTLVGKVMHSTLAVGGYKNGVKLHFPPVTAES